MSTSQSHNNTHYKPKKQSQDSKLSNQTFQSTSTHTRDTLNNTIKKHHPVNSNCTRVPSPPSSLFKEYEHQGSEQKEKKRGYSFFFFGFLQNLHRAACE